MKKSIETMTRYEILDALLEDGYDLRTPADALDVAEAIQQSARAGALLWTPDHIVSTIPRHARTIGAALIARRTVAS